MTRELKPWVVNKVTSPLTKDVVEILLDRNDMMFYAHVNGQKVTNGNYAAVYNHVLSVLKNPLKPVEWVPIIYVQTQEAHAYRNQGKEQGELILRVTRFYICDTNVGEGRPQIYRCDWEISSESRIEYMRNEHSLTTTKLPFHKMGEHFLPYSDKSWANLILTIENVKSVAADFDNFITSDAWPDISWRIASLHEKMVD